MLRMDEINKIRKSFFLKGKIEIKLLKNTTVLGALSIA